MESKAPRSPPDGAGSSTGLNGNISVQLATKENGSSEPVTANENGCNSALVTQGIDNSALVTNGIDNLGTNGNGNLAPVTNGIGNLALGTNGIGNLALGKNGIGNLAQVTTIVNQVEQEAAGPSGEQKSVWIPKALSSTRPPVNGIGTGKGVLDPHQHRGKGKGKVANGFHLETEQPQPEVITRSPVEVKLPNVGTYKDRNPDSSKLPALPKRYLTTPSVGVSNNGRDNVENDLILQVEDILVNSISDVRYVVKDNLGKGSYGQVCKCWTSSPQDERDHVAIKIIKNRTEYSALAELEMRICRFLNSRDLHNTGNIVRLLESFVFAGHVCLVFELLSIDLHQLIRLNGYAGFSLKVVKRFTKQMLEALKALKASGIMHCDLKPENMVLNPGPLEAFTAEMLAKLEELRNGGHAHPDLIEKDTILHPVFLEQYAKIKLIDFGLACRTTLRGVAQITYKQSRHYRSPEVVLKLPYTPAIDMWSLGCIAAELFLGIPLFPGANEYDLFRFMIDILGCQPPDRLICSADDEVSARFFKTVRSASGPLSGGMAPAERPNSMFKFLSEAEIEARLRAYGLGKPNTERRYFGNRLLDDIIMDRQWRDKRMTPLQLTEEISCRDAFSDFLAGVLNFDPVQRWTPSQALQHPFLTGDQFVRPFAPRPDRPRR